jgi:hypothetical protein
MSAPAPVDAPIRKKEEIVALNVLLKHQNQNQTQALINWYQTSSDEAVSLSYNRIFNALLDLGSAGVQAISDIGLLESIQETMISSPNRESSILLLRYYISTDNLEMATTLFRNLHRTDVKLTRKRHAQLLLQAYVGANPPQWSDACEMFRLMVNSYPTPGILGEDVLPFLNPDPAARAVVTQVLDLILGQPIQLGAGSIPDSWLVDSVLSVLSVDAEDKSSELSIIDFTPSQVNLLMDNLDAAFKQKGAKVNPDLGTQYDYIIDGANVMFFIERKITLHSYKRVSRLLKTLQSYHRRTYGTVPKILLVLHRRHLDPPRKFRRPALSEIKFWEQNNRHLDICCTPKGINDDYYSLLNAFPRPKALLITNDKFRDHIFKLSGKEYNLDLIRQWRAEKVIEYDMEPRDDGKVTLHMPISYSFRVQKSPSGDYYIPICLPDEHQTMWARVRVHG